VLHEEENTMTEKIKNEKTKNETINNAMDRARNLYAKGSARTVIFRRQDGAKLFEMNMAIAIIVGVLTFLFAGWVLLVAVVVGYLMKVRVEVIREIEDNATIQINNEE
jgi:hypothetical protein